MFSDLLHYLCLNMVLTCITNLFVLNVMLSPEQHKRAYICTCNYLNIPALVLTIT